MSIFGTGFRLTKHGFIIVYILFIYFFSWYFSFSSYIIQDTVWSFGANRLVIDAVFNFILAFTSFIAGFFIHKLNKMCIIYGYSLFASMLTIVLLFISNTLLRLFVVFLMGISFSVGLLFFLKYFWNLTVPEERGRVAGLAGFFTLPIAYIIGGMAETFEFENTVILGFVLSLMLLLIKLLKLEKNILTTKKDTKIRRHEKRALLLYTIPWVVFCFVNATFARNISFNVQNSVPVPVYIVLIILQLIGAVFGALGGGLVADFFGRRLCLVSSLTLYGIGSALVGLIGSYELLYFVYLVNGANWGILLTLYFFVVWADLSNQENYGKVLGIGLIIFLCTTGVGFLLETQLYQIPLLMSSLISCLLIFLSNIPLLFAPELLSLDFREKIKLKLHFKTLKKIKRKSSGN